MHSDEFKELSADVSIETLGKDPELLELLKSPEYYELSVDASFNGLINNTSFLQLVKNGHFPDLERVADSVSGL